MRWVSLLVLLPLTASAQEVYRWVDKSGGVHYTNTPQAVPQGRSVQVTRGRPLSEMGAPPPRRSAREEAGESEQQQQEASWREAFRQAHDRIRELEALLAEDRHKTEDPSGLPVLGSYGCAAGGPQDVRGCRLYGPNPDFQLAKDRLVRTQAELAVAKERLDDLERRASLQAVPRHWRR